MVHVHAPDGSTVGYVKCLVQGCWIAYDRERNRIGLYVSHTDAVAAVYVNQ